MKEGGVSCSFLLFLSGNPLLLVYLTFDGRGAVKGIATALENNERVRLLLLEFKISIRKLLKDSEKPPEEKQSPAAQEMIK